MSLKAYVTSTDPEAMSSIKLDDRELLSTLGTAEESVAVQMQELFQAVTKAITVSLEVESQLTIEVSGSISLKAEGSTKYLIFNVGAEAAAAGTMKVVLATTLRPKFESKIEKEGKTDTN